MKILTVLITIAVLIGLAISSWLGGCGENYSNGTRTGYVTQCSRTGLRYESYEGDLKIATPGQMAGFEHWEFSAPTSTSEGNDVYAKLQAAVESGHKVTLRYKQWFVKPVSQNTHFQVVEVIDEDAKVPAKK